jgi:hypothetical protein
VCPARIRRVHGASREGPACASQPLRFRLSIEMGSASSPKRLLVLVSDARPPHSLRAAAAKGRGSLGCLALVAARTK